MSGVGRPFAFVVAFASLLVLLLARTPDARAAGTLYVAGGGRPDDSLPLAKEDTRPRLPLERTDFDVEVSGSVLGATVTERFRNPLNHPIEVVYVFPLPERAAVDGMEMKIGTRTVTATIARRDEARSAYGAAVRDGRRAVLLEQERPNVFTFTVGNIDAGATVDVRLHYFDLARYEQGTYSMALPTTIGARYVPGKPLDGARGPSGTGTTRDTDRVPDASRISPPAAAGTGASLGVRVRLDEAANLESVATPGWSTDVNKTGSRAEIRLRNDKEVGDRDFVLRWRVLADTFKPALFAHRPKADEPGYLTLLVEPKHDVPATEIAPRELFFLLDTSGSMHGGPLAAALAAVRRAIETLGPNDTFQIIDFAERASSFSPLPLRSTPENKKRGLAYLAKLRSGGGTNQLQGIHAALTAPGDAARARYVMFFTDGFIGNDADVLALTRREIGRARIHSFGVGSSVNRYLLDEVAIAGRGHAEYLDPKGATPDDVKALVERFSQRISSPYLTEVTVDWGGLEVSESRPAALPDLTPHQPLVLHARYGRPGNGIVTVQGRVAGKPVRQAIQVSLPALEPHNQAVSRLWARATIADLERQPKGVPIDADAIARVALAHDLLTPFTAFVGTDSTGPRDRRLVSVNQPVELPAGLSFTSAPPAGLPGPGHDHTREESTVGMAPPADHVTYAPVPADVAPRRGGCAGCTTGGGAPSFRVAAAAFFFVLLVVLRRARRPVRPVRIRG